MFCINCGNKLEPNMKFCTGCGTPNKSASEPPPNVSEPMPAREPEVPPVSEPPPVSGPEEPLVSESPSANELPDYGRMPQSDAPPSPYMPPEQHVPEQQYEQQYQYGAGEQPPGYPPPAYPQSAYPQQGYPYGAQQPTTGKKNSKIWILIIVGVVALALIIGAIFLVSYLLLGSDTDNEIEEYDYEYVDATPVEPEPEIEPEPEPEPESDPQTGEIPSVGGVVMVNEPTEFSFTPSESGYWVFETSDNTGDPLLRIYDAQGLLIAEDDDGGAGLNALITVYLDAGSTYVINARFFSDTDDGDYTLTVELDSAQAGDDAPPPIISDGNVIPPTGGDMNVSITTTFTFTPYRSGIWRIFTHDNGLNDPFIELFDSRGRLLEYDDDSMGALNAVIFFYMDEGYEYTINATFFGGVDIGIGSYTLTAEPIPQVSSGGEIPIFGTELIEFTPDVSGYWEFYTFNAGRSDPFIEIIDDRFDIIAEDDDSGDGLNARLTVRLEAGRTYYIYVDFWWGFEIGECTLRIVAP